MKISHLKHFKIVDYTPKTKEGNKNIYIYIYIYEVLIVGSKLTPIKKDTQYFNNFDYTNWKILVTEV